MKRLNPIRKSIAITTALSILFQCIYPGVAHALTSGPAAPEFSSFEPVATTNMVNVFSGDFNYNLPVIEIPGSDGAGYAMSLSYHSGSSQEEEASWVGFGWTLNPGSINRGVKGFPDDYDGGTANVVQYNKSRPNWTLSTNANVRFEFFSKEKDQKKTDPDTGITRPTPPSNASFGLGIGLRYNNYQGFGRSYTMSAGFKGMASLSMNSSATGITWSADINPWAIMQNVYKKIKEKKEREKAKKMGLDYDKMHANDNKTSTEKKKKRVKIDMQIPSATQFLGGVYSVHTPVGQSSNYMLNSYMGNEMNFKLSLMAAYAPLPIGVHLGYDGSFSMQYNKPQSELKAYGYLNSVHMPSYPSFPFATNVDLTSNSVQDYYTEKANPFDKQDLIVGIPFANPDNFMLSGEGLSGSFRPWVRQNGIYRPNKVKSQLKILNLGAHLTALADLGVGLSFGYGTSTSETEYWEPVDNNNSFQFTDESTSNPPIFRFAHDMGGSVSYGNNQMDENTLYLDKQILIPGIKKCAPHLNSDANDISITDVVNKSTTNSNDPEDLYNGVGRSSDIKSIYSSAHVLNGFEITNPDGMIYHYTEPVKTRNEANISVDVKVNPQDMTFQDVVKDNSVVYKHLNLHKTNIGIANPSEDQNTLPWSMAVGFANSQDYPTNFPHQTIQGEIKRQPYSSTFLMSSILTSDYFDQSPVGVSNNDLGGWTSFKYRSLYSDPASDWYRWRAPYTGLNYQRNQISDVKDDIATVSTGEKQIKYLATVETKTHIAFFVTNSSDAAQFEAVLGLSTGDLSSISGLLAGSGQIRKDGLGAAPLNTDEDPSANDETAKDDTKPLDRLERILLFAKDKDGKIASAKPIKTVNFEYDYSLVPNVPNNINYNLPVNANETGKLTLKRVWFEYDGVTSIQISPYVFSYEYKDWYSSAMPAAYPDMPDFFTLNSIGSSQNPPYARNLLDGWGNVQPKGTQQAALDRPWRWQGTTGTQDIYDAGAWQLKRITLPSGGEIMIQYESKDYMYVQDRPSMAMVSLINVHDDDGSGGIGSQPTYQINPEDIGITQTMINNSTILTDYCNELNAYFQDTKERIHYKFLFSIEGNNPDLNNVRSEYISGYARVNSVYLATNPATGNPAIEIKLDGTSSVSGYSPVPRQGCYDFASTQRVGKFDNGGEGYYENKHDNAVCQMADDDYCNHHASSGIGQALSKFGFAFDAANELFARDLFDLGVQTPDKDEVCLSMNPGQSYLRVPIYYKAKTGGGSRVKRLLMYDPGIGTEAGTERIYGNEYLYQLEDGTSSGVATNEPSTMKDENPLVSFLPKKTQSWLERNTVGKDVEQAEGPLGESLLPSPSVGHSRVVIKNIYSGENGAGYEVQEFYTCKDYAYDRVYNYNGLETLANASPDINDKRHFDIGTTSSEPGVQYTSLSNNTASDKLNIPAGFFSYSCNKTWATQGFRFIQNEMHGQQKSTRQYYGTYTSGSNAGYLSSGTQYEYYEPGEQIRVLKKSQGSADINGTYDFKSPGKEMEVAMESRVVHDNTIDFSLDVDLGIGLSFFPPITVTFSPNIAITDKKMYVFTASKVISYPAIVRSISNYKDGVWSKTEQLAFDEGTGSPVLTRTTDSYHGAMINGSPHDGSYYNLNIPAYWYYAGMGRKNADYPLMASNTNQLNVKAGKIVTYGFGGSVLTNTSDWSIPVDRVVNATANTYEDSYGSWLSYPALTAEYGVASPATLNTKHAWRPKSNYVYNTIGVSYSDLLADNIVNGGMINHFYSFDYNPAAVQNNDWSVISTATRYSPAGQALEEVDNLGIYSSVRYDQGNHTLPVSIAKNAQYSAIWFNDFEFDGSVPTGIQSHSGKLCESVTANNSMDIIPGGEIFLDNQLTAKGAIIKAWVATAVNAEVDPASITVSYLNKNFMAKKIAKTGTWTLFEFNLNFTSGGTMMTSPVTLVNSGTQDIYVDDVRFQPKDASVTCNSYDSNTHKLLTQFDDQHFGLYYQYNGAGQLVRKLIETENGLKTITETQYNSPTVKKVP